MAVNFIGKNIDYLSWGANLIALMELCLDSNMVYIIIMDHPMT